MKSLSAETGIDSIQIVPCFHMDNWHVDKHLRGSGLGKRVAYAALKEMDLFGIPIFLENAADDEPRAERFWIKNGFVLSPESGYMVRNL